MKQRHIYTLIASTFLSINLVAHANEEKPQLPKTEQAWREAAIQDIQEAYQIMLENHPGVYDQHNPDFLKNLDHARDQGMALAGQVKDDNGYNFVLLKFTNGIHDGHAGVFSAIESDTKAKWPGFVTAWRGDGLYVYASMVKGLERGSRIISCDGRDIKKVIETNVFDFFGRKEEAGQWWDWASQVFVSRGNPFAQAPKRCLFSQGDKTLTLNLKWRIRGKQYQKLNKNIDGDRLAVGLSEPRKNLYWVAMPDFQPDEKTRDSYRAMYAEVKNNREKYLNADALVIDLRHNQGGSSIWSEEFAQALWGDARVSEAMSAYSAQNQTWWRTSKGNADYVESSVAKFINEKNNELAESWRKIAAGMRAASAQGQPLYLQVKETSPSEIAVSNTLPVFTKPVYVVVPGYCVSACLDALDVFTRFPNTRLIGAPSSADSTYMDVRDQTLSSGRAAVVIPNKVYVNRPRNNGEVYTPSIYINDLDWRTENIQKVVEADLKKPAG